MKRGQLQISFSMIFSIILIIVFLSLAVFVILKFLDLGDKISIELFANDVQNSVNDLWMGTQGKQELEFNGIPRGG